MPPSPWPAETIADKLDEIPSMDTIPRDERVELRTEIYLVADGLDKLIHGKQMLATDAMEIPGRIDSPDKMLTDPATVKSLKRTKRNWTRSSSTSRRGSRSRSPSPWAWGR